MSGEGVFEIAIEAGAEVVDVNGHVNNVAYVQWMQDVAIAHSDASGCTAATRAAGAMWVVRAHRVEYLRPALPGETIRACTWVEDFRRARSLRRYEFIRGADATVLARGATDWVFVDAGSGRPRAIPADIRALFTLVGAPPAH
ncbi:MAG: acyl-CoA thioesterase [Gammaproteobacteria bacterium]|nr:acyl-CoA thioesterase [Gammaproteobacteria bacterium]